MINKKTVTIMPETHDAVLCVTFTGTLTDEDYLEYFERPLKKIVDSYGYVNALICFDEAFSGWTQAAADLSFKCLSTYLPKARRIGYVNAPDSRLLLMKMLEPISTADTRFFETAQLQDALKWVEDRTND